MLYTNFNFIIILGGELIQNLLSIPKFISAQAPCIKWCSICIEVKLSLLFTLDHL